MDLIKTFFNWVLKWEGGFSNDPADSGGKTKYGVTETRLKEAIAKGTVPPKDIRDITTDDAYKIFVVYYYDAFKLSQLPAYLQPAVLDFCYNSGSWGIKILQRCINEIYPDGKLTEDGGLGPKTIDALTQALLKVSRSEFVYIYLMYRVEFYKSIVQNNKSQNCFLLGWLNRAIDLRKYYSKNMGDVK